MERVGERGKERKRRREGEQRRVAVRSALDTGLMSGPNQTST